MKFDTFNKNNLEKNLTAFIKPQTMNINSREIKKLRTPEIKRFIENQIKNKKFMIIDKNIPRKEKITRDRLQFIKDTSTPLMSVVEISNSGMCNRKCSFCPRSDPDYNHVNEFISKELHTKIFTELSELKYKGMVIYSGYVEPLLDKKIYDSIAEARKFLPEAQIEIITNGDVLNRERTKKLLKAGYLLY